MMWKPVPVKWIARGGTHHLPWAMFAYVKRRGGTCATPLGWFYSLECAPSQNGALLLCLQPQKNIFLSASAVNFTGAIPVFLWLPSQKGCLADFPQAHQK